MVSVDFSFAFDKSPYDSLIESCLEGGLDMGFAKFLHSFLRKRRLKVRVGKATSHTVTFTSGTPQGSCGSSLYFCAMVQDVVKGLTSNHALFCDDLKIYRACKNAGDLRQLQADVDHLHRWCVDRNLKINVGKSYVQVFNHSGQPFLDAPVSLGGQPLSRVAVGKDLGLLVDDKLQFQDQLKKIVQDVRVRAMRARKMILSRDKHVLSKVWSSYISPPSEYGVGVFTLDDPREDGDGQPRGIVEIQKDLCRIQKRYFRGVAFDDSCKGPPAILRKFRHLKLGLIWSILNGKTALRPDEVFQFSRREGLRSTGPIMPKVTTNSKRRYLGAAAINMWNKLPPQVRNAPTKFTFKRLLTHAVDFTKYNYHMNSNVRYRYANQI